MQIFSRQYTCSTSVPPELPSPTTILGALCTTTETLKSVHTPHTMCIVQPTSMKTTADSTHSDTSNILFQELYIYSNISFRMQLRQHCFGLVRQYTCRTSVPRELPSPTTILGALCMTTETLKSVHTPHTMCIVQPTSMKTTADRAHSDTSNILFQELYIYI